MKNPVVQLANVGKSYGALQALSGVNLSVYPGEVTCVLGDNGAGKSTLIKTLSGVHRPDEGSLYMDGEPVVLNSPHDAQARGVATVFQDLAIQPQ